MSDLLAPFGAPPDDTNEPVDKSADLSAVRTPALITEQEVLFATAAAGALQPAQAGRRWTEVIGAALSRLEDRLAGRPCSRGRRTEACRGVGSSPRVTLRPRLPVYNPCPNVPERHHGAMPVSGQALPATLGDKPLRATRRHSPPDG